MPKPEVHLPCSSCQEIFVRIPVSPTPEAQYAEIQEMLKEKEPKCEKCGSGFKFLLDENAPSGMLYYIDSKYLVFKLPSVGASTITRRSPIEIEKLLNRAYESLSQVNQAVDD